MSLRRLAPVARRIAIDARAKLNLGLAVGPRRPDGFHDLVTVFQSVSLADTLVVEPRRRGFSLIVRRESVSSARAGEGTRFSGARKGTRSAGTGEVPVGKGNLVLEAARRYAEATELDAGARFTLIKRIPVGAGMGGGSADAAAAMMGLRALYGLGTAREALLELALAVGSDVPFAIFGGTALGLGRGEGLTRIALEAPFRAVVAVPAWRVSTALAFAQIDRGKYGLTRRGVNIRSAQILGRKRLSAITLVRLGNTFEKVLGNRRSDFDSLCERLRLAGAVAPRLTGSGSAVFGILGPGTSAQEVVRRFTGSETVFVVRSARSALRWNAAET